MATAADNSAAGQRKPIFPVTPPGLVYVEGEDAVSTNMATEPTLNYGCSGNRSLQLSRTGQLPGGTAYYAEYSFYADTDATYELWYGGTPPGSKDDLALSFASPLSITVDGGTPRALFREDVNVVERYAPSYYWLRTPAMDLAKGAHVLRFEVTAKRRLDDRFFFYIDALFLATPEAFVAAKVDRTAFPKFFPKDPNDRKIDFPFQSIEDYQAQIQAKPSDIVPYIELADEYSLSGDYLNALKTLSKAMIVAPKNADLRLLAAKNRIWRGDMKEGIEAYGIYISLRPDDLGAYEEAGKIAAWVGRFSDSEYFYTTGLAAFPGNSSLTVNKGLALLWASRVADAERDFASAEQAALADPVMAADLAAIYRENGFPDRAIAIYEKAIVSFPDNLGLYMDEEAILASMGKSQAEKDLEARIIAVFEASPELDAALAVARERRQLKADRIAELEARIAAAPDDLSLRDELTRVYAWNGRKAEAARQLESILAARFALAVSEADTAIADVYAAGFSAAALRGDADARLASVASLRVKAQSAGAVAERAMSDLRSREKSVAAAQAAGKGQASAEGARQVAFAAARTALGGLATTLADLTVEDARASLVAERAALVKESMDSAQARDEADEKAFKALTTGLGWTFDAAAAATELALPAVRGEQIAALMRSRVLLTTKDPKPAQAALTAVTSEALASGRLQAELMLAARRDYRSVYKTAGSDDGSKAGLSAGLAAAANELAAVSAAVPAANTAALPEEPAVDADTAAFEDWSAALHEALAAGMAADTLAKNSAVEARGLLAAVVQGATALEDRRLQRAWYSFESGALDLRSELGAYYDGLGQADAATRQYRHVLALDPSNIRAMHSLALAEEKAGDWASAAYHFRAVNTADPYYLNAASRYNSIAKSHAQNFDASTIFLADSNLFDYRSDASATFPLGSFLALKPSADIRTIRDRSLGYPAFIGATLGLEMPISVIIGSSGDGLILRPSASLITTSADFSAIGVATISPAQFLAALSLYSAAGMALDWASGAWRGSASYSYAPLPGSLNPSLAPYNPEIFGLFAHRLEVSGGGYLPLGGAFRYLAPRLYANGSYVPGDKGNIYGTVLAEVIPAFRISDSPWANLGIPLDVIYEDSKDAHTSPYYAADQALTAKAGLLWQSSHALKNSGTLSLSLEGMGGLYISQTFSAQPEKDLYLYGFVRADLLRAGATYSLSFEVSATDPFATLPKYWSVSIMGGVSARQPELIAP